MKRLLNLSKKHVSGHGSSDLPFHCVLDRAQESLDAQVLFDSLEEQFDLPEILVQGDNIQRRQSCVVSQKYQRFSRLGIFESNAAQIFAIVLGDLESVERNSFIADHSCISVCLRQMHPTRIHAALGACDK